MHPILLKIGPFTLHTYGLLVAVGFFVGYLLVRRGFRKNGWGDDRADLLVTLIMIAGLLGARAFYFIFEEPYAFMADPMSYFRVWEGGLVFYGAFIVVIGVVYFFSKRQEISFLKLTDVLSGPLLLAQSFGRIGCFAAGCCYGKATESFLAVSFRHPETLSPYGIPLHPTQLYSSLGNLLLFGGWLFLARNKPKAGTLSIFYLLGYGTFRFFIEFLRNDMRGPFVLSLSPSQWISIFAIGLGFTLLAKRK